MPDPRDDYPAAHSMDTTWFAVDADGHLAVFDSGEDGAVPEAVTSDAECWEVAKRLGRDVPHLVWANGSVRGRHCREPGEADAPGRGLYGVLLFLRRAPDWDTPSPFNQHIGTQIDTPDGRLIPVYCRCSSRSSTRPATSGAAGNATRSSAPTARPSRRCHGRRPERVLGTWRSPPPVTRVSIDSRAPRFAAAGTAAGRPCVRGDQPEPGLHSLGQRHRRAARLRVTSSLTRGRPMRAPPRPAQ